eukprot:c22521_g2_i1 orf=8-313(-)
MALGLDKAASIACIVERQGFKLGFIGSNYFRVKVCLGNNSRRFWRSAKCTMIQGGCRNGISLEERYHMERPIANNFYEMDECTGKQSSLLQSSGQAEDFIL